MESETLHNALESTKGEYASGELSTLIDLVMVAMGRGLWAIARHPFPVLAIELDKLRVRDGYLYWSVIRMRFRVLVREAGLSHRYV